MRQNIVKVLKILFSFSITSVFLYLALRHVDIHLLFKIFLNSQKSIFLVSFALLLLAYIFRGVRWVFFFQRNKGKVTFSDSFSALMLGFFLNNIFPARAGDIARAYVLDRKKNTGKTSTFATIIAERLFDGAALSILMLISVILLETHSPLLHALKLLSFIFFGLMCLLVVVIGFRNKVIGLLNVLTERFPGHITRFTLQRIIYFVDGLSGIRECRTYAAIVALTFLIWSIEWLVCFMIVKGVGANTTIFGSALFLATVNFASLIPASPGGIGTIEYFATKMLILLGLGRNVAFASVISQHSLQYLVTALLGLYFVFVENVSITRLKRVEEGTGDWIDPETIKIRETVFREINSFIEKRKKAGFLHERHNPYLSVVVPAYNEEKRLPCTLLEIIEYLSKRGIKYEVIVVDDGSSDRTSSVVQKLARFVPQLQLIVCPKNMGKGHAVRLGILNAKGSLIAFADADGATPIGELEKLEKAIRAGADLAIGSRVNLWGDTKVETVWYRKLMGRTFNAIINLLVVPGIGDTQCGFKLFKGEVAKRIFNKVRIDGFAFDIECLFLAKKHNYTIAEIPVNWTNMSGSKVNILKDSFLMLIDALKVCKRNKFGQYD